MAELMGRAGARVLLSGVGGDSVVWSEYRMPPQLADLAAAGRLRRLGRELRVWQRETGHPYGKLIRDGVLQPLVPERWRWRLWRGNQVAPWIGRRFARRHRVAELLSRPRVERLRWARPSREQQFVAIREAVHRQVTPNYLEAELMSVEMTYPFLHRPLVEFCLGLPADQFVRPGETRSIHRRALAGVLPPEVARRTGKRGPTEAVMRGLAREWPKLSALFSESARVYDLGIVERTGFVAALEARRFGRVRDPGPVDKVIGLEVWLRGLEAGTESRRGDSQPDAVAPGLHLETVA
jgi:asparagine synthase (glutamine-hydrolysing)